MVGGGAVVVGGGAVAPVGPLLAPEDEQAVGPAGEGAVQVPAVAFAQGQRSAWREASSRAAGRAVGDG